MRKFPLLLLVTTVLFLSTTAAVCDQTPTPMPAAPIPTPKSSLQQGLDDLALAYELLAKKQAQTNAQERHAAEMARQELELQLRAERSGELEATASRLVAENRVLLQELRRRTPPPTRSAAAPPAEGEAPMQMAEAEERHLPSPPAPVVRQDNRPTIIIAENPWAVQMTQGDEPTRPSSPRGRRRFANAEFAKRTAVLSGVGGGVGAGIGAIRSGRHGAIRGTWQGAVAGAGLSLLQEAFRR